MISSLAEEETRAAGLATGARGGEDCWETLGGAVRRVVDRIERPARGGAGTAEESPLAGASPIGAALGSSRWSRSFGAA